MSRQDDSSKCSAITGGQSRALTGARATGSQLGEIGCGVRPLPPSAALAARQPENVDISLAAYLERISGQSPVFERRMVFPTNQTPYAVITGLNWNCPPEAFDICADAIRKAFMSAPDEELAKALYRLRVLTCGRDRGGDTDREAEGMIWIEMLRCWPGDIALHVINSWPNGEGGQWWPTWHEIEKRLGALTVQRRMLLTSLREQERSPKMQQTISPEERASVAEQMAQLARDLVETQNRSLLDEQKSRADADPHSTSSPSQPFGPIALSAALAAALAKPQPGAAQMVAEESAKT
jgi:hypothetical protein